MTNLAHTGRRVLHFLGSVQMAMILLLVGVVVMAYGTVLESSSGRVMAQSNVYRTLWFDAYLALIVVNLLVAVINRIPIRRHQWSFVVVHASIILLLAGAWMSRTYGYEGQLGILEGQSSTQLLLDGSEIVLMLEDPTDAATGAHDHDHQERILRVPAFTDPTGYSLAAESVAEARVDVLASLEKGVLKPSLRPADGKGTPGVEVAVRGPGWSAAAALVADHDVLRRTDLGPIELEILRVADAEQLSQRLSALPADTSWITLSPGAGREPLRVDLPSGMDQDIDCGDGVIAVVTTFIQRARVVDGELTEEPDANPNPAAVVEVRRGDELETHMVFSLFPSFNLTKGAGADGLLESVALESVESALKPVLTVLVAPDSRLHLQLVGPEGRRPGQALELGTAFALSDLGLSLTVERFLPDARMELAAVAAEGEDAGQPCVQLAVSQGAQRTEFWLPEGAWKRLLLGDAPLRVSYRREQRILPFSVELEDFRLDYHPGSRRPASYESRVRLNPNDSRQRPRSAVISMNRPLDYGGFRLFQSGYVSGEGGSPDKTFLSVARDPGVPVVYLSFVLLILGVGWYVLGSARRKDDRATLETGSSAPREDASSEAARGAQPKSLVGRAACAFLISLALGAQSQAQESHSSVGAVPLESTAGWAVLSHGRVMPLDTLAREQVLSVSGREGLDGLDALQVFWGFHLDAEAFMDRDFVRVDNKDLRTSLGYAEGRSRVAFRDLMQNSGFHTLVEQALGREGAGETLTRIQDDALETYQKLERVGDIIHGRALTIVPVLHPDGSWSTPDEMRTSTVPEQAAIYESFVGLAEAYQHGDGARFDEVAQTLSRSLAELDAATYPAAESLDRELFYNRFNAYGKAWTLYFVGFVLLLFLGLSKRRLGYYAGLGCLSLGLLSHSGGLALRWMIAGRVPVSDMYESLVFMGWGVVLIGLVMEVFHRSGFFGMCAGIMGFITLAFSENLPIDSSINPLVPVLANTAWLSVHVMTIMLSYSAFALAMTLAHVTLFLQLYRPGKSETLSALSGLLHRTLQVGLLFLVAGICFGAIWANESWGRYWGWDPKETWSLITFFVYLALVHARFAGWLHHFGMAVCSILGFLSVLMTYYGVNFILGAGLHSYGFASGGMVWVGAYILVELAIIGVASARYRGALAAKAGSTSA